MGGKTTSTSAPRLNQISVQTSTLGLPLSLGWGRGRMKCNLMWYNAFKSIAHTTKQSAGGKGMGGASKSTTYTYTASVIMGICEGPIGGIRTVYKDTSVFVGSGSSALAQAGLSLANGAVDQAIWGYLQSYYPAQAMAYSGIAYVYAQDYALGDSATLANHSFEVDFAVQLGGGVCDADPADIVADFLESTSHGVPGWATGLLGDLADWSTYCRANNLLLSPVLESQATASSFIEEWTLATNSAPYWSEGVLKIKPYGDTPASGNGVTWTPDLTPEYDLTEDDFIAEDGEAPVVQTIKDQSDAYNIVQVEYLDRANAYNIAIATAQDLANIVEFGARKQDPTTIHSICDAAIAQKSVQLLLQRTLYVRETYTHRLPWNFVLLEPMDLVTLTTVTDELQLARVLVRITEIEEDGDGLLTFTCEGVDAGTASAALYNSHSSDGYAPNTEVAPGAVSAPVLFVPPVGLTGFDPEIWCAVASTSATWGGCEVWISTDSTHYTRVGRVEGPARYGALTATLPSHSDPDNANTLAVDLSTSLGTLTGGSAADMNAGATTAWIGGELVSYQNATLTAANRYNLSPLRRGLNGTSPGAHANGAAFVRLDEGIFKIDYSDLNVGDTVFVKFASFNVFGRALEDLADVTAYSLVLPTAASRYRDLVGEVDDAAGDADSALDQLADLANDGVLTPNEKITKLIPQDSQLETAWTLLDGQAALVSGFSAVTSARSTAAAARTAWQVYRNALSPIWNNTGLETAVNRTTFNGKLGDYRYAIDALADALRQYAQTRADWSGVSGTGRPSDNAGTSGLLTVLGSFTTIQGNTQVKTGGTHGAFQGGTVGTPSVGTLFLSSSLLRIGNNSGWMTNLVLDGNATNFTTPFAYYARFIENGASSVSIDLYAGAGLLGTGTTVTGITPNTRAALVYDGTSVFILIDGVKYYQTTVAAGQKLWPKVIDFYNSGNNGLSIKDILYGPWTDQSQAKAAQADATSSLNKLAVISSDSWLAMGEKPDVVQKYQAAANELSDIRAKADALGVSRTTYDAAWSALDSYLAGLSPALTNYAADTAISSTTFNSKFTDYYAARQSLLNAIDLKASQLAVWSGVTGNGRPADGATSDVALVGVGALSIVGNSIIRTSGADDYTAMARSNQPIVGAQTASMAAHPSAAWTMVALDNDASATDTSYSYMLCVAHYNSGSGVLNIYQAGATMLSTSVAAGIVGKLEVSWDGKRFTVRVGGTFYWQSKLQIGVGQLWAKFWGFSSGATYTGVGHRADSPTPGGTVTLYDARNEAIGGNPWEIRGNGILYRNAAQWLGNAYSLESQTGTAMVAARFTDTGANMIGLADNRSYAGSGDYSYGSYLVYSSGGDLYAYESGNGINLGVSHTNASPAVVVITYDGVNVRYYVNAVLKRTVASSAGRTFYVCVAGGGNGQGFTDVQFGAFSQNDWGSVGGANRPDDNATVGGTLGTNIRDSASILLGDADVRNNVDSVIRAPGGGVFTTTTSVLNGSLKIRLPQSWTSTMMRFTVEIYEYTSGFMCTMEVGGYNYPSGPSWYNTSARVLGGSNVEYPVYFGHDGTYCCIWIGTAAETWNYPQVRVRDFFAGYSGYARNLWESGWQISFSTTGPLNVTSTITDTLPGADWAKIPSRSGRPEDNADVTLTSQFAVDMVGYAEISFDYTGTTASGVPKIIPVTVTRGGTNVTTNNAASYSVGNFTGACTSSNITVDNTNGSTTKGRPTVVNGTAAPGTFDWILTYNGFQVWKVTVQVTKKLAAAPAGSGSGASGYTKNATFDGGSQSLTSSSYVEIQNCRASNLVKGTGESIYASFYGLYHSSGTGNFVSRYGVFKLQYSVAGANSWTDFGASVQGGTATFSNLSGDDNPGDISISQSVSPANGNYDVRLVGLINSTLATAALTFEAPAPGTVQVKV